MAQPNLFRDDWVSRSLPGSGNQFEATGGRTIYLGPLQTAQHSPLAQLARAVLQAVRRDINRRKRDWQLEATVARAARIKIERAIDGFDFRHMGMARHDHVDTELRW